MIEQMNLVGMTILVILCVPLLIRLVPRYLPSATVHSTQLQADVSGRFLFFDFIRGIAILSVILAHVLYVYPNTVTGISDLSVNLINNSLRFAIAFFFIASGALLTPPAWNIHALIDFYQRKLVRLALPYALVVGVLGLLSNANGYTILNNFITGSTSVPFYFIIVLFQLYLLYPLIAYIAKYRLIVYSSLLVVLITAITPELWYWGDIPLFLGYLFFFVWGIHLKQALISGTLEKVWWPWVSIIILFFVLQAVLGTDFFYNYRPYYGVASFMIFYLLYSNNVIPQLITKGFVWLGQLSLWIFFLHYPLMEWLSPIVVSSSLSSWPLLILATFISVSASIIVSWLVHHVYQYTTKKIGSIMIPR